MIKIDTKQPKKSTTIILLLMLFTTVANRYILTDFEKQWTLAMVSIAIYLSIYSYEIWRASRTITSLIVWLIFVGELVGVLLGFNLNTEYYSEIMMSVMITAVVYLTLKLNGFIGRG